MKSGECYLITTPPNGRHCFVVALEMSSERYLLLPFSTRTSSSDTSCLIKPGDGAPSFIIRESFVSYYQAKELTVFGFEDATKRGFCTLQGSVTEELLDRILRSAIKSKLLKNRLKKVVQAKLDE